MIASIVFCLCACCCVYMCYRVYYGHQLKRVVSKNVVLPREERDESLPIHSVRQRVLTHSRSTFSLAKRRLSSADVIVELQHRHRDRLERGSQSGIAPDECHEITNQGHAVPTNSSGVVTPNDLSPFSPFRDGRYSIPSGPGSRPSRGSRSSNHSNRYRGPPPTPCPPSSATVVSFKSWDLNPEHVHRGNMYPNGLHQNISHPTDAHEVHPPSAQSAEPQLPHIVDNPSTDKRPQMIPRVLLSNHIPRPATVMSGGGVTTTTQLRGGGMGVQAVNSMNIPQMDSNGMTAASLTTNGPLDGGQSLEAATETTTGRFLHAATGSELWRTALAAISSLKAEHTKSSVDVDEIELAEPTETKDDQSQQTAADFPYKKLSLAVAPSSNVAAYMAYTDSVHTVHTHSHHLHLMHSNHRHTPDHLAVTPISDNVLNLTDTSWSFFNKESAAKSAPKPPKPSKPSKASKHSKQMMMVKHSSPSPLSPLRSPSRPKSVGRDGDNEVMYEMLGHVGMRGVHGLDDHDSVLDDHEQRRSASKGAEKMKISKMKLGVPSSDTVELQNVSSGETASADSGDTEQPTSAEVVDSSSSRSRHSEVSVPNDGDTYFDPSTPSTSSSPRGSIDSEQRRRPKGQFQKRQGISMENGGSTRIRDMDSSDTALSGHVRADTPSSIRSKLAKVQRNIEMMKMNSSMEKLEFDFVADSMMDDEAQHDDDRSYHGRRMDEDGDSGDSRIRGAHPDEADDGMGGMGGMGGMVGMSGVSGMSGISGMDGIGGMEISEMDVLDQDKGSGDGLGGDRGHRVKVLLSPGDDQFAGAPPVLLSPGQGSAAGHHHVGHSSEWEETKAAASPTAGSDDWNSDSENYVKLKEDVFARTGIRLSKSVQPSLEDKASDMVTAPPQPFIDHLTDIFSGDVNGDREMSAYKE